MKIERRAQPMMQLDLTPLVDVVLQLVIFFMISSVFNTAPGIVLDLPKSGTSESVVVTELRLTVINEDEIYINKDKYDMDHLTTALKTVAEEFDTQRPVIVEGSKEVTYQLMIKVLDALRYSGFREMNLITTPEG